MSGGGGGDGLVAFQGGGSRGGGVARGAAAAARALRGGAGAARPRARTDGRGGGLGHVGDLLDVQPVLGAHDGRGPPQVLAGQGLFHPAPGVEACIGGGRVRVRAGIRTGSERLRGSNLSAAEPRRAQGPGPPAAHRRSRACGCRLRPAARASCRRRGRRCRRRPSPCRRKSGSRGSPRPRLGGGGRRGGCGRRGARGRRYRRDCRRSPCRSARAPPRGARAAAAGGAQASAQASARRSAGRAGAAAWRARTEVILVGALGVADTRRRRRRGGALLPVTPARASLSRL
jgi:hypothetical protein